MRVIFVLVTILTSRQVVQYELSLSPSILPSLSIYLSIYLSLLVADGVVGVESPLNEDGADIGHHDAKGVSEGGRR